MSPSSLLGVRGLGRRVRRDARLTRRLLWRRGLRGYAATGT